jgi:hypothetical protein
LYQAGSAKIRFADEQADGGLAATLIDTAGGLTGGDRFEWSVELDGDAKCTVVTQACEKVYRSDGGSANVSIGLKVGAGARLDWLPQETILFDGADLSRAFDIRLADGARLLAVEAVLLGRRAMGEHLHPAGTARRFANTPKGWRALIEWLTKVTVTRLAFEPTGAYHHGFERQLAEAGLPLCKVNRVRPAASPRRSAARPRPTRLTPPCSPGWRPCSSRRCGR